MGEAGERAAKTASDGSGKTVKSATHKSKKHYKNSGMDLSELYAMDFEDVVSLSMCVVVGRCAD